MKTAEKVKALEDGGFDWFKIAELIDVSYEEVREISERLNDDIPQDKTLKELCTIRDAISDLLANADWWGSDDVLKKALAKVETDIQGYK